MSAVESVLFFSLAVCFYVYAVYPLLLVGLARVSGRPVRKKPKTPSMSVIIAAYNEEAIISTKIENTLVLDYPKNRVEFIVASDGSTDRTEEIVSRYQRQGIRLLRLSRCGKAGALNQAAAGAKGEILVFTDANALLRPTALRALAANFHDPKVGGVCGNQRYHQQSGDSASCGEDLYWSYDKWIKHLESQVGSAVAADGSIYAIRSRLFLPITEPAQADDFAISARVVTQGYRLVFEPAAVAYEDAPTCSEQEFWRKVRVTNHSLRGILNLKEALKPWRHGFYAVQVISHKLLRHLLPFFLLAAFIANLLLSSRSVWYQVLLAMQTLLYGAGLIGFQLRRSSWGRVALFYAPYYFCLANAAACVGVLSVLRGDRMKKWQSSRSVPRLRAKGDKI